MDNPRFFHLYLAPDFMNQCFQRIKAGVKVRTSLLLRLQHEASNATMRLHDRSIYPYKGYGTRMAIKAYRSHVIGCCFVERFDGSINWLKLDRSIDFNLQL